MKLLLKLAFFRSVLIMEITEYGLFMVLPKIGDLLLSIVILFNFDSSLDLEPILDTLVLDSNLQYLHYWDCNGPKNRKSVKIPVLNGRVGF